MSLTLKRTFEALSPEPMNTSTKQPRLVGSVPHGSGSTGGGAIFGTPPKKCRASGSSSPPSSPPSSPAAFVAASASPPRKVPYRPTASSSPSPFQPEKCEGFFSLPLLLFLLQLFLLPFSSFFFSFQSRQFGEVFAQSQEGKAPASKHAE